MSNKLYLEVSREPFDLLDAFQDEGYEWAVEMAHAAGQVSVARPELFSYALAMIVDDFIHYVLGYPNKDWEEVFETEFGDVSGVWEAVYSLRQQLHQQLKNNLGPDELLASFERIERTEGEEPGFYYTQMSDTQRLKLGDFIANGFTY